MLERTLHNPEIKPIDPEVRQELRRVRDNFIGAFGTIPEHIDTADTDAYFDEHGLYRSPTVVIPHTAEDYALAHAIATDTKYPIPFAVNKFTPDNLSKNPWEAGSAFMMPSYQLNFIKDYTSVLWDMYQEQQTPKRYTESAYAHELAHSIFHETPQHSAVRNAMGDTTKIYEHMPLSGHSTLQYDASSDSDIRYTPTWIEEAIAVYVAGQITRRHLPSKDQKMNPYEDWDYNQIELGEHYMVRTPAYPDDPGTIGGAIAGQTLENLEIVIPGTIDKIFQIARGEYDAAQFRAELQSTLDPALYHLMFSEQSYDTWGDIYRKVRAMSN